MTGVAPAPQHIVVARPQAVDTLAAIKSLVLDSVRSVHTRRSYERSLDEFLGWYVETGANGAIRAHLPGWGSCITPASVPFASMSLPR
jgi:hypothetical protein